MTTYRKRGDYHTETKRVVVVDGEPVVKQVLCCCRQPAAKARECADAHGNKSRCACFCHSDRVARSRQ